MRVTKLVTTDRYFLQGIMGSITKNAHLLDCCDSLCMIT